MTPTPRLVALLAIAALCAHAAPTTAQTTPDVDRLPLVELAPPAAPAHREGRPVRMRPDPELREAGMRVRIEVPVIPSARARATIRRALEVFFEEAADAVYEARGATITCRAQLALTNLVSYLCTYSGRYEEDTFDRVGLATMTFAIDGDYARMIDEREEIGDLPFDALPAIVCGRLRRARIDCAGPGLAVALDAQGVVVFVPTPGNRAPFFSERITFAELAWRVATYDGVVARIPGAIARASSDRPQLAFERPDDIEAAERAAGTTPAAPHDVLVGAPAPLDVLARRLREARRPVRVVRRADGLYQIIAAPYALAEVRGLGEPVARALRPREQDVLRLVPAALRAALALRVGPAEDAAVIRVAPQGTRVVTVHGYIGADFSDRITSGGVTYVVTDIDAGWGPFTDG